jgi:ThiF family
MDGNDSNRDNPILYERHKGLGINQQQKVAIIGCGGIGSWISLYLGLAGVAEIDIYDSDTISENNLNRFPLGPDKVGVNKAVAMAEHIQSLRAGVSVIPRQNFEPEIHRDKLKGYNWVVVTTDSLKSRRMVYDEVVKAGKDNYRYIGYIECGADGHHMTVTFSPATMATADEENVGYRSVPVFIGPCSLAASIAAYYVLLNTPGNYERTYIADWSKNSRFEFKFTSIDENEEIEIEEVEDAETSYGPIEPIVNRDTIDMLHEEADNEQAI